MRVASVALVVALTILAGVALNHGGEGSELPLPAVIELQGKPPPDPLESSLAAPVAPPALPPPPLPDQPPKEPPLSAAAGGQGAPRQAVADRRSDSAPVAVAPVPGGEVVEIRRYVSFSSTDDYEYGCEEDEVVDPRDPEECEKVDEAEADGHRDQRGADEDDDRD